MYKGAWTFRTVQVARTARLLARTTVLCTYTRSGSEISIAKFCKSSSWTSFLQESLYGATPIDNTDETRDGNGAG